VGNSHSRLNGGQRNPAPRAPIRRDGKISANFAKAMLEPEASAELRDRLPTELNDLASGDDAALWAHRCLVEKNRLAAADAQRVEEAFQARLATFATRAAVQQAPAASEQPPTPLRPDRNAPEKPPRSKVIDKSMLALPERRRVRDRYHVKSVTKHPCLICGRKPSDAHHLRFAQHRALGCKVSDEFTVPLCRGHHREVHRCGDESAWWRAAGIDPTVAAHALWLQTHPLPAASSKIGTPSRSAADPDQKSCES